MATKIVGTSGGAWVQSGADYGDPKEVGLSDAAAPRRIAVPADLALPRPSHSPMPR